MARTGYGPEAFRTMSGHAELDPGHADELADTIDGLTLTPEQSSVLGAERDVHRACPRAGPGRARRRVSQRRADAWPDAALDVSAQSSVFRKRSTLSMKASGSSTWGMMARVLEDRPLGTGNALVDLADDQRGRLVVPTRHEQGRRCDLVQPVGDVPSFRDPTTWNSLGPFIVW